MVVHEDNCVGCPPEMGCLGNMCPYMNVPVFYCDYCGDDASYKIEGEDLCEKCANNYLNEIWEQYSINEKADMINIELERYD